MVWGLTSRKLVPPLPACMQIINHMKLRHPHIIGLREVFLTSTHLVLAMEYAAGGDLFRYVSARRGLPEDDARWFFQQLMVAVDYCHRMVSVVGVAMLLPQRSSARSGALRCRHLRLQGVTSRDIKLENALLEGSPRPLIKVGQRV